MINLKNIKNQKHIDIKIVQVLFYTFPLSFIIGNLILSAHLLLFIIISSICIVKHKINIKFSKLNFLLLAFFLYLFLSTIIQFPNIFDTWLDVTNQSINKVEKLPLENHPVLKSFLLIRFLILIILLDALFFSKILSLKKFFYFTLLCTSFVSIDIIIQYIFGYDLFGYKNIGGKYTGPFGDEAISGSYLQRFAFISFFSILLMNFENKKINKILLFFIITTHVTAIFLSGNRMPMILFLFGLFLMILFIKNFRIITGISLASFVLIFFLIYNNNKNIHDHYSSFLYQINIFKYIKVQKIKEEKSVSVEDANKKFNNNLKSNLLSGGHSSIYMMSIEMWKQQPLVGYGLKSFRFKCWEILIKYNTEGKNLSCSTHSHNYYLEILSETGIVGLTFMIIFFLILIKDSYYFIKKNNRKINLDIIFIIPIIISIFLEIWPIRSAGSFFTTSNATFFWLMVGIFLSAKEINQNNKL